eukprot:Hpha_TRINITY_DN12609_c0_g2::TRINITY_DN12609_c0_g2_i1::g.49884::m.49884/K01104/E3.1.3.48; protein-tyrosine phosphatase
MGAGSKQVGVLVLARRLLMPRGSMRRLILTTVTAVLMWLFYELKRIREVFPAPRSMPSLTERGIPRATQKLSNLRCVFGMKGADGRRVKKGEIFRSARLNPLPPHDGALLNELGVRLIVDLRTSREVKLHPDKLPEGFEARGGAYRQYLVVDGNLMKTVMKLLRQKMPDDEKAVEMKKEMTTVTVNCAQNHGEKFGEIVRRVADGEGPLLIHCTAGKDRTGWGTAVLLKLLGVSDEDVMADYLLSNKLWNHTARLFAIFLRIFCLGRTTPIAFAPALLVDESYMRAGLDAVRTRWGTWESYALANDGLRLDQETLSRLRSRLLE